MNWERHLNLKGKHALLGASNYSWINYESDEQLLRKFCSYYSTDIGTLLHEFAADRIKFGLRLTKSEKKSALCHLLKRGIPRSVINKLDFDMIFDNLMSYVNDSIGFHMEPEVILYYSDNCFGTADAIAFDEKILRIHDLKTGVTPAHMEQLLIYSALFCLDNRIKPKDISYELRIYQGNEAVIYNPEPNEVLEYSEQIVRANKFIENIK